MIRPLGVCLFLLAASAMAQTGFSVGSIDKSVEPCTDFYAYACGTWMKNNPIPPDQSRWGRFNELQERNLRILKDILETSSNKKTRSAIEQRIGDHYAACMDDKAIEAKGIAPLKPDFDRIDALKDKRQLAAEIVKLHSAGTEAFFGLSSGQDYKNSKLVIANIGEGGLTLPDRDYYFEDGRKVCRDAATSAS